MWTLTSGQSPEKKGGTPEISVDFQVVIPSDEGPTLSVEFRREEGVADMRSRLMKNEGANWLFGIVGT